jgi:D-alanyl-D-alanine carboxypeptidase
MMDCLQEALATGIREFGFPGISLSIANQSGIVWSGVDGYSDLERRQPLQQQQEASASASASASKSSGFCIGSITKTLVAVLILQLVDEGKIDLEHTVLEYLSKNNDDDDDDIDIDNNLHDLVTKIANTSTATIRQILCHQSGIPTWEFEDDWIRAARGSNMQANKVWGKAETLKYVTKAEPTGGPGEKFSYSNTNYTLLGLVIESVTGNDVTVEFRRRILDPLGLRSSYLESFQEPPPDVELTHHYHFATRAFCETAGRSDLFKPVKEDRLDDDLIDTTKANLSCEWTAGGMVMSMTDLVTYTRALRDGKLLSPVMMTELLTYRPPKSDDIGKNSAGQEGKTLDDTSGRYSQGICRTVWKTKEGDHYSYFGHGGLTLGFSSKMIWLEDHDLVIACATNVGLMHSGFEDDEAPWDVFLATVLLPAAIEFGKGLRESVTE